MENPLHFYFINGRPSSGKDTMAKKLIRGNPRAVRISTGDISRGSRTPDGPYGRFYERLSPFHAAADKGILIPDEVIVPIVWEVIEEQRELGKTDFIFTGFPRTEGQLRAVDLEMQKLRDQGVETETDFIALAVLEKHSWDRAGIRREIAIKRRNPIRPDDEPEIIENRLLVYHEQTEPMLRTLSRERRLTLIKGSGSIVENWRRLRERLDGETSSPHPERF